MPRHVHVTVALVLAFAAACGGSDESPPGGPQVSCGSTANAGTLIVGAPRTCGSVTYPAHRRYTFTANASGTHVVTVWSTSGDVDLYVSVLGQSYSSTTSGLVDAVSCTVPLAGVIPEVIVASAPGTYDSTYAVQVTGP